MIDGHGAVPFTAGRVPQHKSDACGALIKLQDLGSELYANGSFIVSFKRIVRKALQNFGFTAACVACYDYLEEKLVVII